MRVVIVGGGIGGLAAALFLHARGIRARVFEAVPELRELGVGINIQPHSVRELERIGLMEALLQEGNSCLEWAMFNRFGQTVWREPRGLAAGHDWPQVSIHRGRLQGLLLDAVRRRLGEEAVVTGARLTGFETVGEEAVTARFAGQDGATREIGCDALIGADGIHSAVRRQLYPKEGAPIYAGQVLWRGMTRAKPFFSGNTMIFAGY